MAVRQRADRRSRKRPHLPPYLPRNARAHCPQVEAPEQLGELLEAFPGVPAAAR
ncbi:MAG: hypothetical protein ACRDLO_12440 [Solirubrobacterales bacterium]